MGQQIKCLLMVIIPSDLQLKPHLSETVTYNFCYSNYTEIVFKTNCQLPKSTGFLFGSGGGGGGRSGLRNGTLQFFFITIQSLLHQLKSAAKLNTKNKLSTET